jgi:hypothetical protein
MAWPRLATGLFATGHQTLIACGKLTVCYGKWTIVLDDLAFKMMIFNSYVSLPDGIG